jgi:Lrp/AsnC family leucine-responsive transcriptional regulator
MEPLDRKILMLLAQDSTASINELSATLGVPTSTLHQRIKKLEAKGAILGYQAKIHLGKAGLRMTSFVSLTPIDPASPDNVPEMLEPIAEIESCWSVAGTESYIVKVNVGEPADLERLLAKIRAAANVSTHTTVVLSTAFEGRAPAIPEHTEDI